MGSVKGRRSHTKSRTSETNGTSSSASKLRGREVDLDLTEDNSDHGEGADGEGEGGADALDDILGYFEFKAIIDENKEEYLIDWEGVDPDTDKPWPPSWEPKAGVDRQVVKEWKKAKKANALKKEVEKVKALEMRQQKGKSKELITGDEDLPPRPNSRRDSSVASSSTATLARSRRRSSSRRDRDSAAPEPSSPTGESIIPPTQSAATDSTSTSERRSSRRSNPTPVPSSPSLPNPQSRSKGSLPPSSLKKVTDKGKEKAVERVEGAKKARFEATSSQAEEEEAGNQTTSSNTVPDSQAPSQMLASSGSAEEEGEDELESGMENGEEQGNAQEGSPIPETPLSDEENGDDSDGAEEVGSHLLGGKNGVAAEPERPEEGSGVGSVSPALIFVQPDPALAAQFLQQQEDEEDGSEVSDLSDSDGKHLSRTSSPAINPNATSTVGLAPKSSKPHLPVPTFSPRRFEPESLAISTQETIEDPDSPQKSSSSLAPVHRVPTLSSFDPQRRTSKKLDLTLDPVYQRLNGNNAMMKAMGKGKGKAPQVLEQDDSQTSSIDLTPLESSAGDLDAHDSMDQYHPQDPSQDPVEIGRAIAGKNGAVVGGPFSRTAGKVQSGTHLDVEGLSGSSTLSHESAFAPSNGDAEPLFESQSESQEYESLAAGQEQLGLSGSSVVAGQDDEDLGGYDGGFDFHEFVHADPAHESQAEASVTRGDGAGPSGHDQDVEMTVDESETNPFRTGSTAHLSGDELAAPLQRKRIVVDETTESDEEEPAPKRIRLNSGEGPIADGFPSIRTPSPAATSLAAAASDVPPALASRIFLSPGVAQLQSNGSASSPTMRSSSPVDSESQSRSRNASPTVPRSSKLVALINAAETLANEPETKETLVKFVQDPLAYISGPLFDRPYWCFELREVDENGAKKTQVIIVHPHEGVYSLRKAPPAKAKAWGFDESITRPRVRLPLDAGSRSIFASPKNAREIPQVTSATPNGLPRSTSTPLPSHQVDRTFASPRTRPAAAPSPRGDSSHRPLSLSPAPQPAASTSGHPASDFAIVIPRILPNSTTLSNLSHNDLERRCERLIELRRADKTKLAAFLAIGETPEAVQAKLDALTKANKTLASKLSMTQSESDFHLGMYQQASAAAVARAEEARVAEDSVAQLQGQLQIGLRQRDTFSAGRIKGLEEAYTRVSGQYKLLQEQTRRTNDTQTRQNASLWESHLAQLAKEQGPKEDSSAGDTDWEEEMGDEEEIDSQASSYVLVCEWRSQDEQCGKMLASEVELKTHILADHVPPTMGTVA